jgi:uncharacterized FlgJ-related protein
MLLISFSFESQAQVDSVGKNDTLYLKIEEINNNWLYSEIKEQGIKFPDLVFAQAILETGHFKSTVFRDNNNLFGMRLPKVRKTTAIGKKRGYAVYSDWIMSVQDYKLWQSSIPKKYLKNRETYITYLQRVYCECRNYTKQIKKIVTKYKTHLK